MKSWERQELIPPAQKYAFGDLIALRTLLRLRQTRVSPLTIRRSFAAMREMLLASGSPFSELKVFTDGKRIGVQFAGQKMEPVTGQLLLDFDAAELNKMRSFPRAHDTYNRRVEADRWFQKGIELEQISAPVSEVVAAYRKAAELNPGLASAFVNLGTLCYHDRDWKHAEEYYKQALEADPQYALAHFNLGNLFDELGDRSRAFFHYHAALQLNPTYADAHYNLALLHQTSGHVMKAVSHWKTYLKLDPSSDWAAIARRELDKLRRETVVIGARDAVSSE